MAVRRHVPRRAGELRLLRHRLPRGTPTPSQVHAPHPNSPAPAAWHKNTQATSPHPDPARIAAGPRTPTARTTWSCNATRSPCSLACCGATAVLSAAETVRAELSDADHLGVLGPIWYDLARRAQVARFTAELREALPEQLAGEALSDAACTWLWRSLRHAEVVGLDGAGVLRQAIGARSLIDARHVARVLDSRVRNMIKHLPPAGRPRWADRLPPVGDADVARFMTELGKAMDERTRRIGEHAAAAQPAWALHALGPVPAEPAERAEWQERAARIGAYRELYGYDGHADPTGNSPEAWADWHTAFGAMDRLDGIDLRGATDSQLSLRRAAYQRELAWAPPYVADELRLARLQARTAWENAIRASHSSRAASIPRAADRHRDLARVWQAMQIRANGIAGTLADADQTRREWAALTEPTRRAALAADLELGRRHPETKLPPLTPAEPAATVTDGGSQAWVEQAIAGDSASAAADGNFTTFKPEGERNPTGHSAGTDRPADLGAADIAPDALDRLARIADNARRAQQQIDYLRSMPRYAADDHSVYLGTAWEMLARRERDAIIQPPKPEIVPADAVVQRAQERTAEAEPELEAG